MAAPSREELFPGRSEMARLMRIVRAAFILSSLITGALIVSAQTSQLRLVSTVWPPFTNEPGQPRFALDLVETALSRLGLTSKTSIVDAEQFTPALLNGEFDGSAAAWRDADRDRVLLFSQPYLENRLILVGRKGSDVSATSLAALKGKRVAIVGGYAYGNAIDDASDTFVRSRNEEDSLSLLLGGRADYALMQIRAIPKGQFRLSGGCADGTRQGLAVSIPPYRSGQFRQQTL